MKILVVYDIGNNKIRQTLASQLQRLGLSRIQRSAFAGPGNGEKLKHVVRIAKLLIDPDKDVVHVLMIDEQYWRRTIKIGTPYYLRRSREVVTYVHA